MLQRLKLRSDATPQNLTKVNVVLAPGEGLGVKYEWAKGRRGPHIVDIDTASAASRAGLEVGNVIWSVAGKRTPDHHTLVDLIQGMRAKGGCYEIELINSRSLPTTPVTRPITGKPRANTQPPSGSPTALPAAGPFPKSMTKPLLQAMDCSVKTSSAVLPKVYEVVCPSQPDVEGTYKIADERFNQSPVWHGASGKRLYCTKSGLWALVDCADGPSRNIALVSSRKQARGKAPHGTHWAEWQSWDGEKWVAAPARIEELRIDVVDGRHYWKGAFVEYYGQELGQQKWSEAASESNVLSDAVETMPSHDGEPCPEAAREGARSVSGLTDDTSDDDLLSMLSLTRNGSTYEPPSLTMVSA
eukprot:TRINITY_DN30712_c0_g2_i1.p2 TRINITY_DN30712_c0_g2~~TRINITY_DN30712_c0_g2_i1.p2  ORF type:complete len:358 (+),score=106.09 TRINITY_DN30712_c0_g2_i1:455-1528(+)